MGSRGRCALLLLLAVCVLATPSRANAVTTMSPRNVTRVRTIFSDATYGYRDPTAPVFDGSHWHIWATRLHGSTSGYPGCVWHLFSPTLDADWQDGGLAINRSATEGSFDYYGAFTPSVAWDSPPGSAGTPATATKWYLFYGGVENNGGAHVEALGLATADSPYGPWQRLSDSPIITKDDVPWCTPGQAARVDEAEPYVINGHRRLLVKGVCSNFTALPTAFTPANEGSWMPPYSLAADVPQQPLIPANVTDRNEGFEQMRVYPGPDGLLHMTGRDHGDSLDPHFVARDADGLVWDLVETMVDFGGIGMHELTPVSPADAPGPPGDRGGVPEFFVTFNVQDTSLLSLQLMAVNWTPLPGL